MENEKTEVLFDIDKMEQSIKKAKRRTNWKIAFITVIVVFLVIIVGFLANFKFVQRAERPIENSFFSFQEIISPNEFIGKHEHYYGFFGGENYFTTYKIIEGKVVYTGTNRYGYGLFRDEKLSNGKDVPRIMSESKSEKDIQYRHYNELGHREMVFFYPFAQYKTYRNDLTLLDEIGEDKVMEIALSFDKAYTLKEVQSLIPKQVTLTWLWVDDIKDEANHFITAREENNEVIEKENLVRSEYTAYGVSLIDQDGQPMVKPIEHFIEVIQDGKQIKARWQTEFKRLYETIGGEDGKLTKEDLQFFGAVVTGDAKRLAELKNLPFIKAASIGVVADKY